MQEELAGKDDVLAYIYIIETGVPEPRVGGRSPLYDDVIARLPEESRTTTVDDLLFGGLIERDKFANLFLLTNTEDGHRRGTDIVHARVDESIDIFESISRNLPVRLHRFLFSQSEPDGHELDDVGNWCVLSDPRLQVWEHIQQNAKVAGLGFSARSYVSTRGGKIRESRDVVAGEIIDLCRDSPPQGNSADVPADIDVDHRLYHLLRPPFRWTGANYFRIPGLRDESQRLGLPMPRVQEEVTSLVDAGLLRRDRVDSYLCDDASLLQHAIGQKYLSTLVKWLLEDDPSE